jgi:hypothetical protein
VKLGIVLPSYLYNRERERLADSAFLSLAKSESLMDETVLLFLIKSGTASQYNQYLDKLRKKFRVVLKTYDDLEGSEQKFAFGTSYMLDSFKVDYITWMADDVLFHPLWLWKLEALIGRHPEAKAWSIYRSAFEWMHRTVREEGDDVLVRSICAHGMTFTKKEWQEWGVTPEIAATFGIDGNVTLDVEHPEKRPGERWVTKVSYLEHTGRTGTRATPDIPEYARDFVGTT